MQKKLTKKQFLKRKTEWLMFELCKSLLEKEAAEGLTMEHVYQQFPRVSHFKNEQGEIRVGLSFRGVRRLLKKYPDVNLADVKRYFALA